MVVQHLPQTIMELPLEIVYQFQTEHQQWGHVSGTRGSLQISDFVLPYCGNELDFTVNNPEFVVDNCVFTMEKHSQRIAVREYANNHVSSQETKLFRNFAALALEKPDDFWPDVALKTQRILDACLESARDGGRMVELG